MKKIIAVVSALFMVASMANAQSLLDALKNVAGGVIGNVIANVSSVDLNGTWTYQGVAVAANSDNVLASLAATAGTGTVESKIDGALAKVGIRPGAATLTFNQDNSFTFAFGAAKLPGVWQVEDKTLTLTFMKFFKIKLTGTVKATATGCEILFQSDKFLALAQKILAFAGNISSNTMLTAATSALSNVNGLQLGFKLSR